MIQRTEYPRPQFVRREWKTLNGAWEFAFDDNNRGMIEEWYRRKITDRKIKVPFAYQSELSGIGDKGIHPVVWYQRSFHLPNDWKDKRTVINFNAVDYYSLVWINGKYVGHNQGGYVGFKFDITGYLVEGENEVTIRVADYPDTNQPRGKQTARKEGWEVWYTAITGIWQSVWLEAVGVTSLARIKLEPNIDDNTVKVNYWLDNFSEPISLECEVQKDGKEITTSKINLGKRYRRFSDIKMRNEGELIVSIPEAELWTPETPVLYDLIFRIWRGNELIDEVQSYVGMRKISVKDGKVCLNNEPYYLRMVLDQGFWADGLYTPKSIHEIKYDVEMTKKLGFNGARKHQKIEDPYYYYYCDKIGLLAWCEMAAGYYYDEILSLNITDEWQRIVSEHYNYPSIMAWVPINESWGIDQATHGSEDSRLVSHLETLYHLTKSIDPTRLVIGNDGWQMASTDLIAIHDYSQDAKEIKRRYESFKRDRHTTEFNHGLPILLEGYNYKGQPILITEFGGVKVEEQQAGGWGYGESAESYDDLLERINNLVTIIEQEPEICGYCYTQLTDVEQEVNGLLTYTRKNKVEPEKLARIFGRAK